MKRVSDHLNSHSDIKLDEMIINLKKLRFSVDPNMVATNAKPTMWLEDWWHP